jgi:hypothetical protein
MPSPKAVLRDIFALDLDPAVTYREIGRDGHLTGRENHRPEEEERHVRLAFVKLDEPRHEKKTGEVIKAHVEVKVVEDDVIVSETKVEEKNVDATPVSDSDALGDGEILVLASSKKIKAKKAEKPPVS